MQLSQSGWHDGMTAALQVIILRYLNSVELTPESTQHVFVKLGSLAKP